MACSMASCVVDGEVVAAARHGGVHPGAAHLLERGDLADDHLGHAGRAQVHRGVALDHDHDVAERRDVGAAGGRRAEQAADLRHPARQPHLVVEDPARAPPAREQLDLVGDAGAGRVDQPEHRQLVAQGVLGERARSSRPCGPPTNRPSRSGRWPSRTPGGPSTRPTPVTTPSAGRSSAWRWPAGRPRRTSRRRAAGRGGRARTACPGARAWPPPCARLPAGEPARRRRVELSGPVSGAAADGEDGDVVGDGLAGEVAGRLEQGLAQHVGRRRPGSRRSEVGDALLAEELLAGAGLGEAVGVEEEQVVRRRAGSRG